MTELRPQTPRSALPAKTSFQLPPKVPIKPRNVTMLPPHPVDGGTPKMEAVLDHMARLLGSVLNLRGDDEGDKSLAQLMPGEVEVFPTREKLEELEKVHTASKFVGDTELLALELRSLAQNSPGADVLMEDYVRRHGMFRGWAFRKRKGTITHKFRVGEIAQRASENIASKVFSWLITCDHMMCSAFGDFGDADEGRDFADKEVQDLGRFLSEKIASYVTLDGEDGISVQMLENRAKAEVVRNHARAEANARDCMVALASLHKLAKYGSSTPEAMDIISNRMHHIHWLVLNMPPEIDRGDIPSINPSRLEEACHPDHDLDLRCSLVDHWKSIHGPFTEAAAYNAIERLKAWMEAKKSPFALVIEKYSERKHSGLSILPALPFVRSSQFWAFVPLKGTRARTGLDYRGRRVVRLTSLVWQLLAEGEVRKGVVSASTLADVALTAFVSAQNVSKFLEIKRTGLAPGCHLMSKVCAMTDFHGDLSSEMTNMLCEVSMFSYQDMETVFSHTSPVAPYIMTAFSRMTRAYVNQHIPERYFAVAHDTMRIVLPILQARRSMLGRRPDYIPNPIVEVLKTIPKVREWSPMQGKLVLSTEDLNGSARMSFDLFDVLEQRKFLVQRKRVYIGNGMKSASPVYVFDTPTLVGLLGDTNPGAGCEVNLAK